MITGERKSRPRRQRPTIVAVKVVGAKALGVLSSHAAAFGIALQRQGFGTQLTNCSATPGQQSDLLRCGAP